MTTSKKAIVVPFREGSTIHQMYNDLKDGKVHKFSTFRNKYLKLGVSKPRYMLFRLCRILRAYTPYQINNSKRLDYVQMVERDKAAAARAAVKKMVEAKGVHPEPLPTNLKKKAATKKSVVKSKPAAKKAAKPVAKKSKPIPKPVSKKQAVKSKPTPKPVAVPAGVIDDDDLVAEE